MGNTIRNGAKWAAFAVAMLLCIAAVIDADGVRADYLFLGVPVLLVFYALFLFLSRGQGVRRSYGLAEWLFWISALLLFPWAALRQFFGPVGVGAVFFHVQEGVGTQFFSEITLAVLAGGVVTFIFGHLIFILLRRLPLSSLGLVAASVAFVALNPMYIYLFRQVVPEAGAANLPPVYVALAPPQIVSEPEKPVNLILVYLEGGEATYANRESFGDTYAPITALHDEGLVADNIVQLAMTGWTTAGVVASLCGVPLVPRGLFRRNVWGKSESFMPSQICLGDILDERGYFQALFKGADIEFGSIGPFFRTHGFDKLSGLEELRHLDPDDTHGWGMHDEVVFAATLDEIERLEALDVPYFVAVETVGSHGPKGSLSRSCRAPGQDGETNDIVEALACSLRLTGEFVEQVRQVVDLEDTLIIVMSDHLAHPYVSAIGQLEQYERRNTFIALGAGVEAGRVVSKPATMLDIYPAILSLLGYEISDNRAGLGRSLLSDGPTLVEANGLAVLDQRIEVDTELARRIWRSRRE